ncbi:MAG: Ldh family oxidoreductase [Chloroflexi bacterium]|nr:Ldh family oxidoreductase [Chloroflexota bacterium]
MNTPPETFIRVQSPLLEAFVSDCFLAVGMSGEHASQMARWLTANDLRGVFSHGTRQTVAYVRHFQKEELNVTPNVQIVSETAVTATVDGDGGLGYFPSFAAANLAVQKAKEHGVANVITRNHGHFGAAGLWSRVIVSADLIAYVTSGAQLQMRPGAPHRHAAGGSPMSFAAPAGEEPPIIADFGAVHDLYDGEPHVKAIEMLAPSATYRSIGLGSFCQILGGFLCGVPSAPERAQREWRGANQGAFMTAHDVSHYMPLDDFKREVDDYIRQVRELTPITNQSDTEVAGGMEAKREQLWREEGVPVGPAHAEALRGLGQDLGVEFPF